MSKFCLTPFRSQLGYLDILAGQALPTALCAFHFSPMRTQWIWLHTLMEEGDALGAAVFLPALVLSPEL